ncbi:hypothetical protein L6164_000426 [Bauhinia variegata]|nr:hypothetical protein L6164_000426 [Bauhinia variegata]
MSAGETGRSLAGLTLHDVLANREAALTQPHQPPRQRTLVDIIREDESTKKDKKTWKAFKDKLRLKRTGSTWTSSVHIPASDILNPIQFNNTNSNRAHSRVSRGNTDASTHHMDSRQVQDINPTDPDSGPTTRPQFSRGISSRYDPTGGDPTEDKFKHSIKRNSSTRLAGSTESIRRERVVTFREPYDSDDGGSSDDEEDLAQPLREVRTLSAREAVAAQEAAEAAAAAEAEEEAAEAEPVKMSLMDLLEETDRQMGLEGTMYGEYDSDYDDEEEEEEEEKTTVECTCCVCMVRHKGAAFIPCGHTFCRMCSRELLVSRGNCPLCNNFIVEILDIF